MTDIKERIDTKEKFTAWLNLFSQHSRDVLETMIPSSARQIERSAPDGWWLQREIARLMYEFGQVYHPLPDAIVELLYGVGVTISNEHFVHLSTTDPTKIAYTDSWEAGVADRQLQITLGKYIKKYHPSAPEYIVKEAQEYLNNLSVIAEVKFTTDLAKLITYYARVEPACMSKSIESYRTNGLHPLKAYDAPGFALAYMGDDTSPSARCITWVNPADERDKRYVRVYGNRLLAAQLDRLGYRRTNLAGAHLKRIDFEHGGMQCVLCPYIDDHSNGRQGTGNTQSVLLLDNSLQIVRNDTPGAIATSPMGSIRVPAWRPVLLKALDLATAEARLNGIVPETGHADSMFETTPTGFAVAVLGFDHNHEFKAVHLMGFRTREDLNRHTIPLADGLRIIRDRRTCSAWSLRSVMGSNQFVRTLTRDSEYVPLDANYYPRTSVSIHPDDDRMYMYRAALRADCREIRDGCWALASDFVTVTHGAHAGEVVFHDQTYNDAVDPGHIYHIQDCTEASNNDDWIPNEFLGTVPGLNNEIRYDTRTTPIDEQTGLPINCAPFAAGVLLTDLVAGRNTITLYNEFFILWHRERRIPVYLPWGTLNEPQLLAQHLVAIDPIAGYRLAISSEITRSDHECMKSLLDAFGISDWHYVINRSLDEYAQGNDWSPDQVQRLRTELMACVAVGLDKHDNTLETLAPQPETAVEQPAPQAEAFECEP